jgi:predicted membrane channel-forming protein YqfA (hemolysin III family)
MLTMLAEAFGPGCPWWEQRQAWGAPNVKWCEETICAWVNEPANAWSNLGYIAVAAFLLFRGVREKNRTFRLFGAAYFGVGVSSGLYHATNNFYTQIFDFVGMFIAVFLLVVMNLRRLGVIPQRAEVPLHVGLVVLATALIPPLHALHIPFQPLVLVGILAVVATEARLRGTLPAGVTYRDFLLSLGTLAFALVFSVLDVTRTACDPQSHLLQGHAIWHVLGAVSLYFCARFYGALGIGRSAEAVSAAAA